MVKSAATTANQYLAELPADRRAAAMKVRDVILRNLPRGYEESVGATPTPTIGPRERRPHDGDEGEGEGEKETAAKKKK